jgi:hypothetical protein
MGQGRDDQDHTRHWAQRRCWPPGPLEGAGRGVRSRGAGRVGAGERGGKVHLSKTAQHGKQGGLQRKGEVLERLLRMGGQGSGWEGPGEVMVMS